MEPELSTRAVRGKGAAARVGDPRWAVWLAAGLIMLAAFAAFHNSLGAPFLFDDTPTILENPTIRRLWPVGPVLAPPAEAGTGGRPLLNLTFAVNYAAGGTSVRGYHAVNLAVHALAALVLFGLMRRTLGRPELRARFGGAALPLALATALLWAVHPLQTESVVYVSQRAEALMGLFYLSTLYAFARGAGRPRPGGWFWLACGACVLGMATKEVMVTAPVAVLLYDRAFFSGSFGEALRSRRAFYAGLAATWLVLACLMAGSELARRGVGFAGAVTPSAYAQNSGRAVVGYLGLSVWPHPLVFDYGIRVVRGAGEAAVWLLAAGALATFAVVAWRRWPRAGFAAACFFIVLAPTSTVVPVGLQPMAEHRVYLPLAALAALASTGAHVLAGRRMLAVWLLLAAGLGVLTVQRNGDYRSALAIWTDTAAKRPANARAHNGVGEALLALGREAEAVVEFREAVRLAPGDADYRGNLCNALHATGRNDEALRQGDAAVALEPDNASAHNNLANALLQAGRTDEALAHLETAVRLGPGSAGIRANLANTLAGLGRGSEAVRHYEEALRLNPDFAEAHRNLGLVLSELGRTAEAIGHCETAVRLAPGDATGRDSLGLVLADAARWADAAAQFEEELRLRPDSSSAHNNLGTALARLGRTAEAVAHFEVAVRLDPGSDDARANLERLRPTPAR